MKKILITILAALTMLSAYANGEDVVREHRAIWISPWLGSWPGGPLTNKNETSTKRNLRTMLEKLHRHGINTLYYHVRANADACYESAYEPWSSSVAGSRGGTPYYDPFAYFVETCHEYGIEVYAWVNPYRYSQGGSYGAGERNYENSHPDWLLTSGQQKILNPGLPEARQRVVDVCTDIVTKYDIDGMIFDDYFYHSSIGFDADADLYNAYKSAGGTLDQGDWRRENINIMIHQVRDAVKAVRPYTVFSMGPAGRISPPNIGSYGLEDGPYGDMNYTGLYADPIYWLSQGWLDFLSPQVYWHSYFDKLTEWYSVVLPHFNRHLYTSVDASRLSNNSSEYIRQIEFMRSHVRPNESGVVFFDYSAYNNYREAYNGKNTPFGEILQAETFPYTALSPIHHWRTVVGDYEVGPVTRSGSNLQWSAPTEGGEAAHRYAVYAIPATMSQADFCYQPEFLVAPVYTESYAIPEGQENMKYAVAVYDRYSNLHSARFEGTATLTPGVKPTALHPASGIGADLCELSWTHEGAARYQVEMSASATFDTYIGVAETFENSMPAINVADMEEGKTYYWRVKAYAADHTMAISEVASFTASRMKITSPSNGSNDLGLTPTITWSPAEEGSVYTMDLATDKAMNNPVHTATTTTTSAQIPDRLLVTGKTYYVRVIAERNGSTSTTEVVQFATADRTDYTAPVIVNPAAEGDVVHADESIILAEWAGMTNAYIEICGDTGFAVRSSYKETLSNFATTSKALGDVKIATKPLEAGKTYYVRTRGGYNMQTASGIKYTAYGPVRSFVYSDQAGIFAPETEGNTYVDAAGILHTGAISAVRVYDLSGREVLNAAPSSLVDLSMLASGVYVIHTNNTTLKWVK